MPHLARTILPRIRASIERRGLATTLSRAVLLPIHLLKEHRSARGLSRNSPRSEFDTVHGVETDGDLGGWTFLSDLKIPSPNWIHGVNYCGIEPARFLAALLSLDVRHEDYTFIDFGSGKGRALLMASEFPFRKVVGIEFSAELDAIAKRNVERYGRRPKGCQSVETVCMDFVDFVLPPEPLVLYFFEPCDDVLFARVLANIEQSLVDCPRPLHVVYLGPGNKEAILDKAGFLEKKGRHAGFQFSWYSAPLE
jgi:SAM-dependent methyltransferase